MRNVPAISGTSFSVVRKTFSGTNNVSPVMQRVFSLINNVPAIGGTGFPVMGNVISVAGKTNSERREAIFYTKDVLPEMEKTLLNDVVQKMIKRITFFISRKARGGRKAFRPQSGKIINDFFHGVLNPLRTSRLCVNQLFFKSHEIINIDNY